MFNLKCQKNEEATPSVHKVPKGSTDCKINKGFEINKIYFNASVRRELEDLATHVIINTWSCDAYSTD